MKTCLLIAAALLVGASALNQAQAHEMDCSTVKDPLAQKRCLKHNAAAKAGDKKAMMKPGASTTSAPAANAAPPPPPPPPPPPNGK